MSEENRIKTEYGIGDIYKQLFDAAGEGLIISNSKGEIILSNPSANKIFGYDEIDALNGLTIDQLVPNDVRQQHVAHRKRFLDKPAKRTMGAGLTLFARKKDGSKVPVEISLNHFSRDGETFVMAMITDTTKKWELDNQLKREKETAQLYLDIASAIFIVIDANEKIELLNRSGEELLGVKAEEIKDYNWFDEFVHHEDIDKAKTCFLLVWQNELSSENYIEFRVKTKKNGIRIISWQNSAVKDENGKMRAVLCSGQDITERVNAEEKLKLYAVKLESHVENRTSELSEAVKELENANERLEKQNREIIEAQELLQESQKLYKIIARNFPKGTISVFDKNLNYVFVEGKELYEMGVTSEMLIGTNLVDRLALEIREKTRDKLMEVFNGEAKRIEVKQRDNFYVLNAVPLRNYRGKVNQIMVVEQNVTDSKLAEDNIKNALKKERDLGELKTRFVSMASHEFRTPLSTILSSNSLIKKYLDLGQKDKADKHIQRIKASVSNLTNILNDFLSLGKLEEGKVSVNLEEIQITDFLQEIVEEMQSQAMAGQEIICKSNSANRSFRIDIGIFRIILSNLLSNAVKYSPENSKITLEALIEGSKIKVAISDQGMGIPEHDQKFLFERFFRAKNASNIQGTGLGLNIVQKYVELLKGSISFSSVEMEGTTFTIIFDQEDINRLINTES